MRVNLFLLSCLFAFLAGHMVNYGVIFLSLEMFNSHALAGLGFGLCFMPPIVLGWMAGVFCDRYSPRSVILIAQNSYLVSFILLSLVVYDVDGMALNTKVVLILIAAFFSGVGWSFVAPARFASLPFYVDPHKLTSASVALNLVVMTGFGLAPLVLKFIQVNWSWAMVMIVGAIFTLLSTAILLPLSYKFVGKKEEKAKQELLEGIQFVRQSKPIIQLLSLAAITYALMGPMQVLLPSVAKDILNLSDMSQGRYLSLVALALIFGGVVVMLLKSRLHYGYFLFLAISLAGVGIGALGLLSVYSVSALVLVIAGALGGMAISLIVAGLQHYAPSHLRGRIMSVYTIISQVIPATSGIIAGALASTVNLTPALIAFGVFILLFSIIGFWRFNALRRTARLV